MNKFALLLLLSSTTCLTLQRLKQDELNVYVTRTAALFASNVSDFDHLDLRNSQAVYIEPDGNKGEWQELKRGRGKTRILHNGQFESATDVGFRWQYSLDANHIVVTYWWVWIAGSSSQSDIIQVFESRDGKVFITQQIEADTHGGGTVAGASFNRNAKSLTVKAVELDSPNGRCCPTHLNIVVFHWDGMKFRQASAHQIPMPAEKSTRQKPATPAPGTILLPANQSPSGSFFLPTWSAVLRDC